MVKLMIFRDPSQVEVVDHKSLECGLKCHQGELDQASHYNNHWKYIMIWINMIIRHYCLNVYMLLRVEIS